GSFTYDQNGVFDSLAVTETAHDGFSYQLVDAFGAPSNFAAVDITINGVNDAPVISVVDDATPDSDSADLTKANGPQIAGGTLRINGVDTTDTVTMSLTNTSGLVSSGYDLGNESLDSTALAAFFTVAPGPHTADTGEVHNVTWSFDSTPQAFDFLQDGEDL